MLFEAILTYINRKGATHMGRDNKQGQSNNKASLPQTPKNQKIAPNKVSEEFSQEFMELINSVTQNKKNKGGFR